MFEFGTWARESNRRSRIQSTPLRGLSGIQAYPQVVAERVGTRMRTLLGRRPFSVDRRLRRIVTQLAAAIRVSDPVAANVSKIVTQLVPYRRKKPFTTYQVFACSLDYTWRALERWARSTVQVCRFTRSMT